MEKKALPAAGKGPSAISIYHFLNIGKMHLFKFGAKNFACSGTNPTCFPYTIFHKVKMDLPTFIKM